jgi:hypothetical protein
MFLHLQAAWHTETLVSHNNAIRHHIPEDYDLYVSCSIICFGTFLKVEVIIYITSRENITLHIFMTWNFNLLPVARVRA